MSVNRFGSITPDAKSYDFMLRRCKSIHIKIIIFANNKLFNLLITHRVIVLTNLAVYAFAKKTICFHVALLLSTRKIRSKVK